jgi:23S rRNA (pseudouridine1915-N3)-methyltransferase
VRLRIVGVGRIKEPAARALVDDYIGRIGRYCRCDEIEIDAGANKQQAAFDKALGDATLIALDVLGKSWSSRALAQQLERWASRGKGVVAFVIGGADGLPAEVVARAHARWSLSALTFPHRLARVIVAEQLYRALTIMRGEPYDH